MNTESFNTMIGSIRLIRVVTLSLLMIMITTRIENVAALQALNYRNPSSVTLPSSKEFRLSGSTSNVESWSRSSSTIDGRYGIQNRARAVLDKAKQKTGINNINSESSSRRLMSDETTMFRPLSRIASSFYLDDGSFLQEEPAQDEASLYNQISQTSVDSKIPSTKHDPYSVASARQDSKAIAAPLPFVLPTLTAEQEQMVLNGQRVQQQSTMSREGSGFVVMDIQASDYIIWEALLDFEAYPQNIGTVRSMQMFTNNYMKQSFDAEEPLLPGTGKETLHYGKGSITRASFVLSKFRLNIAAVHKYVPHPDGHYMEFSLDKANKNVVLKDAKGIWYTQSRVDKTTGQNVTRVWLLCELKVSSLLPQFIVDYAARKAMPRATNWLIPTVERIRKEFEIPNASVSNSQ